jgi:hypothetical protein
VRTRTRIAGALFGGLLAAGGVLVGQTPAEASTVVGVEYEHGNFGGATLTSFVNPNGFVCTASFSDVDATFNSVPSGWDNVISSFRTFSVCWTRIWEHPNRAGASFGFAPDTSYVGDAMNDRTSSYDAT